MKALMDDKVVELTPEQVEEFNEIPIRCVITDKDRISALENAIADIAVMMVGGVSND